MANKTVSINVSGENSDKLKFFSSGTGGTFNLTEADPTGFTYNNSFYLRFVIACPDEFTINSITATGLTGYTANPPLTAGNQSLVEDSISNVDPDYTANYKYVYWSGGSNIASYVITINADVKASTPTPPPEPTYYQIVDEIPQGWQACKSYTVDSVTNKITVVDPLDVSQLKYAVGDTWNHDLCFVNVPGWYVDDSWYVDDVTALLQLGSGITDTFTGQVSAENPNDLEESEWVAVTFELSGYTFKDYKPTLYLSSMAYKSTVTYHVTLSRLNCTANLEDISEVNDSATLTIVFTAYANYEFAEVPYCQWGDDTVYGELADETHATITLSGINQNLTVVAQAVESTVNPPTPSTGLPFINVYTPTLTELRDAANSLFIQLSDLSVVNIQQYVVALHKVFVPLVTFDDKQTISFGKYVTTIASEVPTSRNIHVSCGSVKVEEQHHNALDYSPYTTARIWLPFLGFFDISVDEVMNEEVMLHYTIDIITGRALAEIEVNGNIVYRFVGSSYSQEPYYFEQGEQLTTAVINEAYNMADFTPYILLERPINLTPPDTVLEGNVTYFQGVIGDQYGLVICDNVLVENIDATEQEKREIESLLRQGILVD